MNQMNNENPDLFLVELRNQHEQNMKIMEGIIERNKLIIANLKRVKEALEEYIAKS